MMRSLQSGVSGLINNQLMLETIGNNIANINTIGYKRARVSFADHLSQTLQGGTAPRDNMGGSNPIQVGLGLRVQSIDTNFGQGSIESTGFATDLAIEGEGFFIIRNGDSNYYSRAGNFTIDSEGRLVSGGGSGLVQGRMADVYGEISDATASDDIILPLDRKIPAQSTSEVSLYCNLDSSATNADASLTNRGISGVNYVNGTAVDGVGGTHKIEIRGNTNSTFSTALGTAGRNQDDTLGLHGVTSTDGFTVTVDADTDEAVNYVIAGLTPQSTVGDMLNALNAQVNGATFELDANGSVVVTRDYAGDGSKYNVRLSDTGDSDIVSSIFGSATFDANDGVDSDLVAVDIFTEAQTGNMKTTTLELVAGENGLITELNGLGGGGVTVRADEGFNPTTLDNELVIETEGTTHSTSIMVYDALGNTHTMSMTFHKTAEANEWAWEATVPEPASIVSGNTGIVNFNEDGSLSTFTFDGNIDGLRFNPGTNTEDVIIALDAGQVGTFSGISQTNSAFTTRAIKQNGYGMGTLTGIQIDENGGIIGSYSNNVNRLLAEITLANFENPNGLEKVGGNMWSTTAASGEPVVGLAETNFGSSIQSGYLELSNVDLTNEFAEMIKAQRSFQANSRVITVSDQFLSETTMLKR